MIQRPLTYFFDSRYGPSVNTASPSRPSMTVAVMGDARRPAKTQWPSACSSLKALIAAISSAVAESDLS